MTDDGNIQHTNTIASNIGYPGARARDHGLPGRDRREHEHRMAYDYPTRDFLTRPLTLWTSEGTWRDTETSAMERMHAGERVHRQGLLEHDRREHDHRQAYDYTTREPLNLVHVGARGRDQALPGQDRREHDHLQSGEYTTRDLTMAVADSDMVSHMQRPVQEGSWFTRAKHGFNALRQQGEERRAALLLRDHLRTVSDRKLHDSCQAHLPDILSEEGPVGDQVGVDVSTWVEYVLKQLSRVAGLDAATQQRLLGELHRDQPGSCPPFAEPSHPSSSGSSAVPFWANRTWVDRSVPGADVEDLQVETDLEEEKAVSDDTSLFQADRRSTREGRWPELMERFWGWFDEGRSVQLALAMLRQRTMDRTEGDYHQWVAGRLRTLGYGLEPNEQASAERTPMDFYRWARQVEDLLYTAYRADRHPSTDEVSMMDRYRNGRRRIRDSRTPRREPRETRRSTECVTTETRVLVGRGHASSGSAGPGSGSEGVRPGARDRERGGRAPRAEGRRPNRTTHEERASGSGDLPRRDGVSRRAGRFNLPDPQQQMTQNEAVTMWKYLLFDRWAFDPPEETGVIPTTWLPRDTLRDVSAQLATMSQANILMMTVSMVTMVRYLMAELSQQLDMAQVILNTENGEPAVDLDDGDAEPDEAGLMQSFFGSQGQDTPARRWARALMRLHKELEGQPKAVRCRSVASLRAALPPPCELTSGGPEGASCLAQLQALLTAISEDCAHIEGALPAPAAWLSQWAGEIAVFVPGFRLQHQPQMVETQLNVTLDELLADEEEERSRQLALHQQQEDEEKHRAAHEHLQDQEIQHLMEEAKEYQEWERDVQNRELHRAEQCASPPHKRRCLLTLEVASSSTSGPQRRVLEYELPLNGTPVTVTLTANMAQCPSEVSTVPVLEQSGPGDPPPLGDCPRPVEPGVGTLDSLQVQRPSQVDMLAMMDFDEYEGLYDKWRRGEVTQQEIQDQHGSTVVELILAQEAVRDAIDGEASEHGDTLMPAPCGTPSGPPDSEQGRPRCRFGTLELIYEAWKYGRLTDAELVSERGPEWLALFQQWRVWGLEAIWSLLDRLLDMEGSIDPTTKAATALRPPEPLELPLRVPAFAVRGLFRRWDAGEITTEDVRKTYGEIWPRLLNRMRSDTACRLRDGWSALVDWDQDDDHASQAPTEVIRSRVPLTDLPGGHTGKPGMLQQQDGTWRRFTMEQFATIYEAWRQGRVTTEDIRLRHGVDWLALFVQWRTWGREAIWDFLPRVLDVIPDGAASRRPPGLQFLAPEELSLPLKIPWSTLREIFHSWLTGRLTTEQVTGMYGTEWVRLFRQLLADGLPPHRASMEVMVYWDVEPGLPRDWLPEGLK